MPLVSNPIIIKEQLYKTCQKRVEQQLHTLKEIIASNQLALGSETKSSAGDKHETGRAMLHLEIEKASTQLGLVLEMHQSLGKISLKPSRQIKQGSLVLTDTLNYFISLSLGLIRLDSIEVYAISPQSPIGKLLLGKSKGEVIFFKQHISIEAVY